MKFIDLFCGLGGFHLALEELGHECVMASELDPKLRELYEKNHGILPKGDITQIEDDDVPDHDVLCAGFPCQPFSKAGARLGRSHPAGQMFDHVLRILKSKRPEFVLLENVPNLLRHDEGRTWGAMQQDLMDLGYDVKAKILSPYMFGVPQARDRAIIVARQGHRSLSDFSWPKADKNKDDMDIRDILEHRPSDAPTLSENAIKVIDHWQKFIDLCPADEPLPGFPVWSMEFRATYPFEGTTPLANKRSLHRYKGSFGQKIHSGSDSEFADLLPRYAHVNGLSFPPWKEKWIGQNRDLYGRLGSGKDEWIDACMKMSPSMQKLEWNWSDGPRDIRSGLIQFRASGVRVKRPTVAPSLVATAGHVPIIPWENRRMTMRECARLQSMENLLYLPDREQAAFKALGNAVNVKVIREVAESFLSSASSLDRKSMAAE